VTKGGTKCPANGLHAMFWTKSDIKGDLTIREFVDTANGKCKGQADSMNANRTWIYAARNVEAATFDRKITDASVSGFNQSPSAPRFLFIAMKMSRIDDSGEGIQSIPPVLLKVK
jgi:hypothetical protein